MADADPRDAIIIELRAVLEATLERLQEGREVRIEELK